MPPPINALKPDDVVRTPSGVTGVIEQLNADGSRDVRLPNGELVSVMPCHLFLLRAAIPRPWKKRTL